MKTVFLTNSPAPYRELVHQKVAEKFGDGYIVYYCAEGDDLRVWEFDRGEYKSIYLKARFISLHKRSTVVYLSSDITKYLREHDPDIIIITGFSLPMVIAYTWAWVKGKKIIAFSDSTLDSESGLTSIHRLVRWVAYRSCDAFIGVGDKTHKLFKHYAGNDLKLFKSYLCANNKLFEGKYKGFNEREFDIILCGRMIELKMFDFSIKVIHELSKRRKVKVNIVGDGPERDRILSLLDSYDIEYKFSGFLSQEKLPDEYTNSRIFLFPSKRDAWGVVANEALVAGTPVITCPAVGAADELIITGENGYVLELDSPLWVEHVLGLLEDSNLWSRLSVKGKHIVSDYTYDNAGQGIIDAIEHVGEANE